MSLITENNNKWTQIIKEDMGVTNPEKLSWISKYAQVHEIFESGQPNHNIAATPMNTLGMGNPNMPTLGAPGGYFNTPGQPSTVGSGDIPMSTLTMSLEIAATTIGLELVSVVPSTGPWAMLQYLDFPYAGGKDDSGRTAGWLTDIDGKGEGAANKPLYIKLKGSYKDVEDFLNLNSATPVEKNTEIEFKTNSGADSFKGVYYGRSRIDGGIIVRVLEAKAGSDNASIAQVFSTQVSGATGTNVNFTSAFTLTPELVAGAADHIQGFANFFDSNSEDVMSRAENETGTGNTIGLRFFTKMVQMGSFEVTGTVTRQQLQDLPLYGIDAQGSVLEAMQNNISQSINNRILDRLFKLGTDNAIKQKALQGVDLNLYFGDASAPAQKDFTSFSAFKYFKPLNETLPAPGSWNVVNATKNTSAENFMTHQRRIMSRILAASNLIANVSRHGRASWVVVNTQIATALQDNAQFIAAAMSNTLSQDAQSSVYHLGSIAGLQVYVEPNMKWDDTRVLVGRKATGKTPGVVFMPYILSDTIKIIAEGTMAPKMLTNSRFAIVDAGFHPEFNYLCFAVDADGGYII